MSAPTIVSLHTAQPPHFASQEELVQALQAIWSGAHHNADRLAQLHRAVRVRGRHLALPVEEYAQLGSFSEANAVWTREATRLGAEALSGALEAAGLSARALTHLFFVTVTGIATPSVDARLVNRLGLRPDVKRTPIFGLGCVAGAAGLARVADALRGDPEGSAALVAVELCSLTLQKRDVSVPNVIASGLFGDGAAAVVVRGGAHGSAGPRIVATRSVFYPDTERVMGWDVVDSGFQIVLDARVPQLVTEHLRADVDAFLAEHGLSRRDVAHWVCHTGGPKVLEAFESALELPDGALAHSWASLEEVGNLSSVSVLEVLGRHLASGRPQKGERGMAIAMGPGFCAELVLLEW